MSARACHTCQVMWPANEQYTSTFGSRVQRPVNEVCPACGAATRYAPMHDPSDAAIIAETLAEAARARERADAEAKFEAYYTARAVLELYEGMEAWLNLESA